MVLLVTLELTEHLDMSDFYVSGGDFELMRDLVNARINSDRTVNENYFNMVVFSAYHNEENNLFEVPVTGRVKMVMPVSDFFSDGTNFESEILKDPTWIDLCVIANDMINVTGDNHHTFFESIHLVQDFNVDEDGFFKTYTFMMGS
jgi:hypothetical protein